ncbi:hypothetical protein OIU77_002944 [Salix suchowensis]|uniref:DUF4220 domain-containing protein n=1 Tax=Salix suchowensis TaxID=1278906 RepID=A0ABQ9B018_9ROSI|nr:hypothetical protein OIU77_002944 [Salix suchowensis]
MLLIMTRRRALQVIPPSLRELWSSWQLRVLVLTSLILQIVLIIFGNRRKYISRSWVRFAVWSAYLAADTVATMALGVISSKLGEIYDDDGSINPTVELNAFWTPFLLLHLGGPDTITAYSLEDNELWSRHFLGLVMQAIGTLYIIMMAWTGSHLSVLLILMTIAGLIKFGERTWVLRSASNDQLRDSMRVTRSDQVPGNSNLAEEYKLRDDEGYNVIPSKVIEIQFPVDPAVLEGNSISKDHELLLVAYGLFHTFKGLFADVVLGSRDRDTSQTIFRSISYENAYKLIEMECGLMYDLLYTKAILVYNPWGLALRFISFMLACIVLVLFSLTSENQKYSKVDLSLTFILLAVAIFLEIYAILVLLSSDWTIVWLSTNNKASALKAITSLSLLRNPRWSNSMAQYSLLSFTLEEKPAGCVGILRRFSIVEQLEQQRYLTNVEVTGGLKEWVFNHFKKKLNKIQQETELGSYNIGSLNTARGNLVLQKYGHSGLNWSIEEVEFDRSILIWHIATEICCNLEDSADDIIRSKHHISKLLSEYMLYLLVMNPSMLPAGMGQFVFEDTCAEAVSFFSTKGKLDVHKNLLEDYNTGLQQPGERYRSKNSVLSDACRLAQQLVDIPDKEQKWSLVADVWVEMLAYVAYQSNGRQHADQLRGGGEFLTHVWLLMAHFGLTEHFQIPQRREVARLIIR